MSLSDPVAEGIPASWPPDAPSFPTLTDRQVATIRRQNAKRRCRDPHPFTSRDDEVAGLHGYTLRLWLDQPEVLERLESAASVHGHGRQAAIDAIASDAEGLISAAGIAAFLLDDWLDRRALLAEGWSPPFGGRAGRAGRGRTMEPSSVLRAIRSLALRPVARSQLNQEREAGYRGGVHRSQRGHEHLPEHRARGVRRADELAAREVNTREGRVGAYAITSERVERDRERLRALIA